MVRRLLGLIALSALSGVLLVLSDYPVRAWPLQVVALLPFLFALERLCLSRKAALLAGLALGLANGLLLLFVLEFPLLMGGGLALYASLLWMLMALGIYQVRSWPSPLGPFAAGAVAALVAWAEFTLLPVFGTAQSFSRVWSAAPFVAQVTSAAGMTGLVYLLVSMQALCGRLIWGEASRRRASAVALSLLLAATTAWCRWSWTRPSQGELSIAVMGWTGADLFKRAVAPPPVGPLGWTVARPLELFDKVYRPLVLEAARRGAELIVSPEVGFFLRPDQESEILARATRLAREVKRALVIGAFSDQSNRNRAILIDGRGSCHLDYSKTHLIPAIETYQRGSGALAHCPLLSSTGLRAGIGLMICQDDNFTDLARAYGRANAQVMAVPTNDWRQVKDFHLENSIFRAVENRYAVARASSNGVSAIISPRGEVLARHDHFRDGLGLLLARVPLRGGSPTLYARSGDWPPFAGLLLLGAGWLWRRRQRGKEERHA